jgi:ribosomal protein S18 acetylase RimI-like enzyme
LNDPLDIISGSTELLDRIAPLWEQQRDYHASVNATWARTMRAITFPKRRDELVSSVRSPADFRVHIALVDGVDVGYAISIVPPNNAGVIESLFVREDLRGRRIGERLLHAAIAWLRDERKTSKITLSVLIGNDAALRFYERHGFAARTTQMQLLDG